MSKICYGCGSKLQYKDPNGEGYIPLNKYDEGGYCQRCFKLIHYGINNSCSAPKSMEQIISSVNGDNKFVIFLCDFLSLSDRVLDIFKSIKQDKLLLISKSDIIPSGVNPLKVKEFIKNYYDIFCDIMFISSYRNKGIENLINYLDKNNIKESYVLGLSNSGKSTLINKIMEVMDCDLKKITTSNKENTTLDFIRININNKLTLVDSPGFIIPTISVSLDNKLKDYLKPKVFQMKKNEVLKIDNMFIRFDNDTNVTLYVNNDLYVKKYYKDVSFTNQVKAYSNSDLILLGVGFINIKSECNLSLSNISIDNIELRDSIFGVYDE